MRVTFALPAALRDELLVALDAPHEVAGVLSAQLVRTAEELTVLGRHLTWAADEHYLERSAQGLQLGSAGWVPAFRRAAAAGDLALFVHTHPGGRPEFSRYDDEVDRQLAEAARSLNAPGPYGAILVSGDRETGKITGRLYLEQDDPIAIGRVRICGENFELTTPGAWDPAVDATFDRQIRLFGAEGQQLLHDLHVGVVGCGGTGSAVAEQLTRLGIGRLTLIDDDEVTAPTPTRGYGMRARDLGRPKAAVLADHLAGIGLGTDIRPVVAPLHDTSALDALVHADVVFCCVDGHGARLILNRWAYAHCAPVLDLAVLVGGQAAPSIDARVTWIAPGSACLLCRGRIDPALAYAENLDPQQRQALAGEGYVAAAETPQPAVVTLTTLVASTATTELLLRLFQLGDSNASELLLRPQLHELRRNRVPSRPGCFCSDPAFIGRGRREPYLDLMWT